MTIFIRDIVKSESAIAYDDGSKCLNLVMDSIEKDGSVVLDFQGINFVITAILNPVIGDLIIKRLEEMENENVYTEWEGLY